MDHATHADPRIAAGKLIDQTPQGIVLALPGTDYKLHLAVANPLTPNARSGVEGQILAQARRVDIVDAGGVFIEPIFGRPRRIQGKVVAADPATNTLTVKAVTPFVCKLDARQKADEFPVGCLVSFDIERGARFEPMK